MAVVQVAVRLEVMVALAAVAVPLVASTAQAVQRQLDKAMTAVQD
jgi:hypothetical protein